MQSPKPSIIALQIIVLTSTLVPGALSQSGRGRPKVPQPSPATSQPKPINVPASASVTRQEQIGTTTRFQLRNGMTVVISEQHATSIAAAVAYFKGPPTEPGMSSVARLAVQMILRRSASRSGNRGVVDLRALGATLDAVTSHAGTAYSLIVSPDKLREALAIQAEMLQHPSLNAEVMRREMTQVIEEEKTSPGLERWLAFPSQAFTTRKLSADPGDQALANLMNFDDPAAYSMARLVDVAFSGGVPANPDSLRRVSVEQLADFYRRHYRPENLIISIAGDVSTFNTLVDIQQLYGEFKAKPELEEQSTDTASTAKNTATPSGAPARTQRRSPSTENQQTATAARSSSDLPPSAKPGVATPQERLRYAADRADITQSIVSVGFPVPGVESKEWPAIEVLMAIAGLGRASRLSRSLIDGQMVVNRLESNYIAFAGMGLLSIQIWPASGDGSAIDKAESALFKELDRVRRELPSEGELSRARTLLEKRFQDATGVYLGRAHALARSEAAGAGFRDTLDYQTRIRAVSAEDVQRAAGRYLTISNTSVHEYEPLSASARTFDAASFTTTVTAWAPGFARPVETAGVRATDANSSIGAVLQGAERSSEQRAMLESVQPLPIRDFSTLNGARAFVREDHSQPEVTVALLFQGGRLIEDASTSGTTELMLRSILYGTPRRSFAQMTEELEQLGADVRIVVEPDYFGFILSVLSRNADRALKLLRDAIEEPAFRDDDIARARLGQIASIRDARDSSFERSRELLLQAIFPGHPYSLPSHGREEVVAALTSGKLRDWYASAVKRQLPLAIIVGDTDGSALVSSQLAEGFKRREVDAAIQVRTPQLTSGAEKIEERQREQTTVAVGLAGAKAGSGDLTAIQLIESAMNGGSLLRELRDNQHIVSMTALDNEAMFVAGAMVAYAVTSAENEQRVRIALLAELHRIVRGGLTADELETQRAVMATSRTALLQQQSQHAIHYARAVFYRKQASEVDTFGELASKVTSEDLKRVAASYLKTSTASASVLRGTSQPRVPSPPKQD